MKPHIPRLIHGLLEDDPDRRSQFCEHFVSLCKDNTTFLNQIVWTDEATFKLSGLVKRHNCVYWSDKNPHFTIATELNQPGIIVWAGISSAGIVGPVFFEGTVFGEKYLKKLKTAIVPALKERPDFTACTSNKMEPHPILQQLSEISWMRRFPINGLTGEVVSNFLHAHQTLTSMDFCVWGIIKKLVYSRKPRSVEDIRQFFINAFANFDHDLCTSVCRSVFSRCRECIEVEGLQFEYLS